MRNSLVSAGTSGGLLSTFASITLSKDETALTATRQDLTIIRDKKRVRSRLDIGNCKFDSLALIPSDIDVSKSDDCNSNGKRKRERSRPRAIDQTGVSLCSGTLNDKCQNGLKGSSSIDNKIDKNTTCDVDRAKNPTTSQRDGKSKPTQAICEEFEMHQDEDSDIQSINCDHDISITCAKDPFKITSPDSYRDLGHTKIMGEPTAENVVTPIKTRKKNSIECDKMRRVHDKNITLRPSKSLDIVTPSPTRQQLKRQNIVTQNPVTSSDITRSSLMNSKRRKLKRVSKLRSSSMKKPVVALTQAITVGNKTIPARHTVCASEGKKRVAKPVSPKHTVFKSHDKGNLSKELDLNIPSTDKHKDCSVGSITNNEWKHVDSTTTTTTKPKNRINISSETSSNVISTKVKSKSVPKHPMISSGTHDLQKNHSTKKLAILDFIQEIISKLDDLKDDVKHTCNDEDFLVDVTELRKRYVPLSARDLFLNACTYKDTLSQNMMDEKLPTWIGMNPMPSNATPSLKNWNSNTVFSHLFHPPSNGGDGEESSCESVIDLGTVSDPHALVKYALAQKVSPTDSKHDDLSFESTTQEDDDHDDDHDGYDSISDELHAIQTKREVGKSRIWNNTSDILATFASVTPTSVEEQIVNHSTDSSINNNINQDVTIPLDSTKTTIPTVDPICNDDSSLSSDRTIQNRFKELFDMDHDELIENELRERSISCVVTNNPNTPMAMIGNIANDDSDFDKSSNNYDESPWDDLFFSIPTISY